jgi:predicted ATPase
MIERIQIRGFKSIRELDLPLRPLNLLIGANGVGKSNFISFFKLLNQLYEQRLKSYVAENGFMNSLLFFGAKHMDSISGFVDFSNTNAYFFQLKPDNASEAVLEKEYDLYNYINDEEKKYTNWSYNYWTRSGRESTIKNDPGYRAKHMKRFLQSFKIYHFHDTSATAAIKGRSHIEDVQRLYEDGRNLAAFLYFLQNNHPGNFRQIEKAVQSVAPFFKEFNLFPSPNNRDSIQLVWKSTDESEQNFFAFQLSDGTLRFMALATLLLQPEPPATILIDEPELGLHPFAIGKLAALLQKVSGRSQVIVSTQSVELLNHFEPEDVVVVEQEAYDASASPAERPQPRQSVFRRLESEELGRWLENYSLGELWKKNVLGGRP